MDVPPHAMLECLSRLVIRSGIAESKVHKFFILNRCRQNCKDVFRRGAFAHALLSALERTTSHPRLYQADAFSSSISQLKCCFPRKAFHDLSQALSPESLHSTPLFSGNSWQFICLPSVPSLGWELLDGRARPVLSSVVFHTCLTAGHTVGAQ